jgi:hypothetical protein
MRTRPHFLRLILWDFSGSALIVSLILMCQRWSPIFAWLTLVVGVVLIALNLVFTGYQMVTARPLEWSAATRLQDMGLDFYSAQALIVAGMIFFNWGGSASYIGMPLGAIGLCGLGWCFVRWLRLNLDPDRHRLQ